jgi:hypothetical protein
MSSPSDRRGEAWETPATINHTWGYRSDDHDWKNPGTILFKLVDIVSKGGNYLLNVGPTADGVVPQTSQDVLRAAGEWLKINGDAVYGAGPSPFGEEFGEYSARGARDVRGDRLFLAQTEWRVTTKPGKLFLFFFSEPRAPFEHRRPRRGSRSRGRRASRGGGGRRLSRIAHPEVMSFGRTSQDAINWCHPTLATSSGQQAARRLRRGALHRSASRRASGNPIAPRVGDLPRLPAR